MRLHYHLTASSAFDGAWPKGEYVVKIVQAAADNSIIYRARDMFWLLNL